MRDEYFVDAVLLVAVEIRVIAAVAAIVKDYAIIGLNPIAQPGFELPRDILRCCLFIH